MVNESKNIKEIFDSIAGKYDFLNHTLSFYWDIIWRKKTAKILAEKFFNNKSRIKILDLSTGTGDMIIALSKKFLNNSIIYGLDFSFPMLKLAKKKLNKSHLIQGDIGKLPFSSETFDLITVAFGLRNFYKFDGYLKEIIRVTRRKGKIAFLEFSKPSNFILRKIYFSYLSKIVPKLGHFLAKNYNAYNYLSSSIRDFPSEKEVASILYSSGLKNIKTHAFTNGIVILYIGEKE